jgi:hypothetical protein
MTCWGNAVEAAESSERPTVPAARIVTTAVAVSIFENRIRDPILLERKRRLAVTS